MNAATYSCAPQGRKGGERLLHSPAGVKDGGLEFREPAAERWIGRVVCDIEGRSVGALTGRVVRDDEGRPVGALTGRVVRDDEGWCVTMKGVLLVL